MKRFGRGRHQKPRVKSAARQSRARVRAHRRPSHSRPAAGYRQRSDRGRQAEPFNAPETWHEPDGADRIRYVVEPPGRGYVHPVTIEQVRRRIELLPTRFTSGLEVVQFSRMTRKRALFPCYGMQWGSAVYLYPIEESLTEVYVRAPRPQQQIEVRMYGGRWSCEKGQWKLQWTRKTIRDFYLNNVLIHEIGHICDDRNSSFEDRERYANWFAVEYGYRASRGRR